MDYGDGLYNGSLFNFFVIAFSFEAGVYTHQANTNLTLFESQKSVLKLTP